MGSNEAEVLKLDTIQGRTHPMALHVGLVDLNAFQCFNRQCPGSGSPNSHPGPPPEWGRGMV